MKGAQEQIVRSVRWDGVSVHAHRFGGIEFRLGKRELGHVHGDSLVDIPFPMSVRNQILASGLARPHHVLPRSGWVSVPIKVQQDVATAVELLRLSYDIAFRQKIS